MAKPYGGFWSSPPWGRWAIFNLFSHEFVSLAHIKNKADNRMVCSLILLTYEAGRLRFFVLILCRKRARRESEDSGQSDSEEDDPTFAAGSDSDGGEGDMAHIGQEELTPAEKIMKKREKPITR